MASLTLRQIVKGRTEYSRLPSGERSKNYEKSVPNFSPSDSERVVRYSPASEVFFSGYEGDEGSESGEKLNQSSFSVL